MRQENKRYVLNESGNVDWGEVNELIADDGTKIKKHYLLMGAFAHRPLPAAVPFSLLLE